MQQTVYNPQKGRLETIDITFTDTNTTWFDAADDSSGVSLIADFEGGLIIGDSGYSYPVLIHDLTRSDINHDRKQAQALKQRYTS
jgi:hypothetical protein